MPAGAGDPQPEARGARRRDVRIGEASRILGVSPSTLRAWERAGWLAPGRTNGRQRVFSMADLNRIRDIQPMVQPRLRHLGLRPTHSEEATSLEQLAGPRLRTLRVRKGMSMRAVARAADVSPAYLSTLERGLATPTVALLQRVAAAMGVTVLEAFRDHGAGDVSNKLVRTNERRAYAGFNAVHIEDLVGFSNAILQIEIFAISPGGGSGGSYRHEGEEAIFLLEGELVVWLDEAERYDLSSGDTLYFRSDQAHRWQNPGAVVTRLLWVNTPPTF